MISEKTTMRDAFFNRLYDIAKKDRDVVLVSADMGAPSLDKFRKDLSEQYIDVGIAEQNAALIASGLALSGKKAYVYAIMPFVTTRIHEMIKLEMGCMKIPINVVGVGTGYSYEDSGPTHHTIEDISIIRPIPNVEIFNPSDSVMAAAFADMTYKSDKPTYLRLDRHIQPIKYSESDLFEKGFKELKQGKDLCLVATGDMVTNALNISSNYNSLNLGVIDVYRLKPLNPELKETLSKYKNIISLEEHLLAGGFGSMLSEMINDNDLPLKLKRVGVNDLYNYEYGGRENIQNKMGIGKEDILNKIKSFNIQESEKDTQNNFGEDMGGPYKRK